MPTNTQLTICLGSNHKNYCLAVIQVLCSTGMPLWRWTTSWVDKSQPIPNLLSSASGSFCRSKCSEAWCLDEWSRWSDNNAVPLRFFSRIIWFPCRLVKDIESYPPHSQKPTSELNYQRKGLTTRIEHHSFQTNDAVMLQRIENLHLSSHFRHPDWIVSMFTWL